MGFPEIIHLRSNNQARIRNWFIAFCVLIVLLVGVAWNNGRKDTTMREIVSHLKVDTHETKFSAEAPYFTNETHPVASKEYWKGLFTSSGGFVTGADWHFPSDFDRPDTWCLSVFHQLHCLQLLTGAILNPDLVHDHGKDHGFDPKAHIAHCVDYLRQSIMCSGDLSLEPTETVWTPEHEPYTFVRFHGKHVCRNWEDIMEFSTKWDVHRG